MIVIHAAWLVTVQAHCCVDASTLTDPVVASLAMSTEAGEIENVQAGTAAACVTVTVLLATVRVPVRGVATVFGAIENVTVALPLAAAPLVTVIHEALDAAVQPQLRAATTSTADVPPAASMLTDVGDTVNVHWKAACVTVNG